MIDHTRKICYYKDLFANVVKNKPEDLHAVVSRLYRAASAFLRMPYVFRLGATRWEAPLRSSSHAQVTLCLASLAADVSRWPSARSSPRLWVLFVFLLLNA